MEVRLGECGASEVRVGGAEDGGREAGATLQSLRVRLVSQQVESEDVESLGLWWHPENHWIKPYLKPIL